MNDLITVFVFAALLVGFGFACTMGAGVNSARVAIGAVLISSGVLLAVGMIAMSLLSVFVLVWRP